MLQQLKIYNYLLILSKVNKMKILDVILSIYIYYTCVLACKKVAISESRNLDTLT